ncbi:MAG: hypothetical protein QOH30_4299 [Baekduia sp.]|nr:hypothetical protein [Baekduia sp.]
MIREATEADLQQCNNVWASTQVGLGDNPIPYQPLSAHELKTGRLVVADVDGEVVGFGGTLTRSGVLYLADLFVIPAQQNRGLGRQLLKALCVDHRGPLFTFASADPRAQRLYEQFSMRPVEQYHYLDARVDRLVAWATDVDLKSASPAEVLTVDAVITRRDRTADIDFATQLGAAWYLAYRGDACLGVAAVAAPTWWSAWHPRGACVGPVVAHDPADVAPIMAAALSSLHRVDPVPDIVSMFCPASHDALPALLAAGFEIIDTDLLMSSNPTLIDRRRYVPTVETP